MNDFIQFDEPTTIQLLNTGKEFIQFINNLINQRYS